MIFAIHFSLQSHLTKALQTHRLMWLTSKITTLIKRILNCESFSATYLVQPMRCLPLGTAHDSSNHLENAANPTAPRNSFQGNQQRHRCGWHAVEKNAWKSCRISTFSPPPILWIMYYEMIPRKNIIDKNSSKSQSRIKRQWTSTFAFSDSDWLQRLLKALLLMNYNMHPSLPGNHLK